MLKKGMMKSMEITEIKNDKRSVRKKIAALKKELSEAEICERSENILKKLYATDVFKNAERVYTYVNYNQEINTKSLIEHCLLLGMEVLVPRVDGESMEFYRIGSLDELSPGAYGIPEPVKAKLPDSICKGLMIMPGMAFDSHKHRIGYGGGFYDKYLIKHPSFFKVALCYDFQILDSIPAEEYDIPADMVISDTFLY